MNGWDWAIIIFIGILALIVLILVFVLSRQESVSEPKVPEPKYVTATPTITRYYHTSVQTPQPRVTQNRMTQPRVTHPQITPQMVPSPQIEVATFPNYSPVSENFTETFVPEMTPSLPTVSISSPEIISRRTVESTALPNYDR